MTAVRRALNWISDYFPLWTLHYYMTTSYTDVELRNSRIRYLPRARYSPLDYLHFVVKKLQPKMQEHVLYICWRRSLIDSTEVLVTNSNANAAWIACFCLWKICKQTNYQPFTRTEYKIGPKMAILARMINRTKSKHTWCLENKTDHVTVTN